MKPGDFPIAFKALLLESAATASEDTTVAIVHVPTAVDEIGGHYVVVRTSKKAKTIKVIDPLPPQNHDLTYRAKAQQAIKQYLTSLEQRIPLRQWTVKKEPR
jgi:hypothetical protein